MGGRKKSPIWELLCPLRDCRKEGLPQPAGRPSFAHGSETIGRGVGGVYWTMSAILFVLWVLGLISGSTEGRWVHLLLIFSMVTLILALARRGRGALA